MLRRASTLSSTTEADVQRLVDTAPQAAFYFSDLWALYRTIVYTPDIDIPCRTKARHTVLRASKPNFAMICLVCPFFIAPLSRAASKLYAVRSNSLSSPGIVVNFCRQRFPEYPGP
jgi:hypothetical protein